MSEDKKPRRGMRLLTRAVLFFAITTPLVRLSVEVTARPRVASPFLVLAVAREYDRVTAWAGRRVCAMGASTSATDTTLLFALYTYTDELLASGGGARLPPLARSFASTSCSCSPRADEKRAQRAGISSCTTPTKPRHTRTHSAARAHEHA
jgi:hypothetical protein